MTCPKAIETSGKVPLPRPCTGCRGPKKNPRSFPPALESRQTIGIRSYAERVQVLKTAAVVWRTQLIAERISSPFDYVVQGAWQGRQELPREARAAIKQTAGTRVSTRTLVPGLFC